MSRWFLVVVVISSACSMSGLSRPPTEGLLPPDDRGDAFRDAGAVAGVPAELLGAIARAETGQRHLQGGVEFDGWPAAHGMMGLRGDRLDEAATLLGDRDRAQTDLGDNVLATALLLDRWADEVGIDRTDLGAWAPLVARYSGIDHPDAVATYVHDEVYALLRAYDPDGDWVVHGVPSPATYRDADDITFTASPNISSRGGVDPQLVVVHTCEGSYSGCWGWLVNPAAKVSAHYVVDAEGTAVRQLVDEADKAWHIGATYRCALNDDTLCAHDGGSSNALSIGIEHAGYASQESWSEGLIARSAALVCDITARHDIPADAHHVVGHGQLQPYNRTDPGAAWPWTDYLDRIQDCRTPEADVPHLDEPDLSGASGDRFDYVITLPEGSSTLTVTTSGGTGDADLYVRHGEAPTSTAFDCRPYKGGNDEQCVMHGPAAGDWHLALVGYSAFSGVALQAEVAQGEVDEPLLSASPLAGSTGTELRWTVELPEGREGLSVQLAGGVGDADLYVRHGAEPTTSAFDCRPYVGGNDELCTFEAPAAGTWHLMVRGYQSFGDAALTVR